MRLLVEGGVAAEGLERVSLEFALERDFLPRFFEFLATGLSPGTIKGSLGPLGEREMGLGGTGGGDLFLVKSIGVLASPARSWAFEGVEGVASWDADAVLEEEEPLVALEEEATAFPC